MSSPSTSKPAPAPKGKRPAPAPEPPAPPTGKVSAAILETLKQIEGKQDRILAQLEPKKGARGARTRRNMYGENVPDEEEE